MRQLLVTFVYAISFIIMYSLLRSGYGDYTNLMETGDHQATKVLGAKSLSDSLHTE